MCCKDEYVIFNDSKIDVTFHSFSRFLYAQRWHWDLLKHYEEELFGSLIDPEWADLKRYQDLLVFAYIKKNIPPGSKILDVGGGLSRILSHFSSTYECWNIDKLEGIGNGPRASHFQKYRVVLDYMGNFNTELPDNYFDFVFSISALEHVPQDDARTFDNIVHDINRVLKPGGVSLHLFDIVYIDDQVRVFSKFIYYIITSINTVGGFLAPNRAVKELDLYFLSQGAYEKIWQRITKKSYHEFGKPTSINILWKKGD